MQRQSLQENLEQVEKEQNELCYVIPTRPVTNNSYQKQPGTDAAKRSARLLKLALHGTLPSNTTSSSSTTSHSINSPQSIGKTWFNNRQQQHKEAAQVWSPRSIPLSTERNADTNDPRLLDTILSREQVLGSIRLSVLPSAFSNNPKNSTSSANNNTTTISTKINSSIKATPTPTTAPPPLPASNQRISSFASTFQKRVDAKVSHFRKDRVKYAALLQHLKDKQTTRTTVSCHEPTETQVSHKLYWVPSVILPIAFATNLLKPLNLAARTIQLGFLNTRHSRNNNNIASLRKLKSWIQNLAFKKYCIRKANARTVVKSVLLKSFLPPSPLTNSIQDFRNSVIKLQRFIKSFLTCLHARALAITIAFDNIRRRRKVGRKIKTKMVYEFISHRRAYHVHQADILARTKILLDLPPSTNSNFFPLHTIKCRPSLMQVVKEAIRLTRVGKLN